MRRPMEYRRHVLSWAAVVCCAATVTGCAGGNRLRIDPTGQRLFTVGPAAACNAPLPSVITEPVPGLQITPSKIVAPVGSEVILITGLPPRFWTQPGRDRVEWMLSPNGEGHFVATRDWEWPDYFSAKRKRTRKIDNSYAITAPSWRRRVLTRGTPIPTDDIPIDKGQAWITLTSPVEGTSRVTAYAPSVPAWDQRTATAAVYWVDAQWAFPPPAINPAGTQHAFTTVVARQTDGQPVEGWRVRYEILDGPAAGFAPDGAQMVEVETNEFGQATANIYQSAPGPGTNRVGVQVIRPADPGGERLVLGTGTTTKTWTSGELQLRTSGPTQVSIGQTASYTIEVVNNGATPIRGATVSVPLVPQLTYTGANPAGVIGNGQLTWQLGDVYSGTQQKIEVNYRVAQSGTVNHCASLSSSNGVAAQDCVSTTVTSPALDVRIDGPEQAMQGQDVQFTVTVTNRGQSTARGILVVDRFDAGLVHAAARSPIERDVRDLGPGEAEQFAVTFQAAQLGRQCTSVEVISSSALPVTAEACVNVVAGSPVPPAAPPSTGPPSTSPPPSSGSPSRGAEPGAAISVRKSGPAQAEVGETVQFEIDVANTGQVPLSNVQVYDSYDETLSPVAATAGHRWAGDDLYWLLDRPLQPGASVRFQVQCECSAEIAEACNRATASSAEQARDDDEACLRVGARRPSAPQLDVRMTDLSDPVRVGAETTYVISVRNQGADPVRNVAVFVEIPPQLVAIERQIRGPAGHQIIQQNVQFDPIAEIRPGERLEFEVPGRALAAGRAQVRVSVSTPELRQPVRAEQTTTVLTDR